ncbi:hypothetical protein RND81_10G012100 [Saponaria officinalis]|uniref:Integrase catalytic domain-containing protein n=1 Tax=Saponaria officinalis TaxID=3572 RepID=A0AAW1HZG1_SAPOF
MAGDEEESSKQNSVENTHTLKITTMLTGSENFPLWKRQMELALSAKRKLGYVTGKIAKPKEDKEKIETWTVANNQVITWISQNVSERIKMDVLEKRYMVANGARKFKLNRESYEITHSGRSVEEYFIQLQVVWDELDRMNVLPQITKITTEIAEYLAAVDKQEKERKLFQFLNGLDKEYGILRSNILMMDPVPSMDQAVSLMLQEETQTTNLGGAKTHEASALLGKGETEKERCSYCGRDNHGYKRSASNMKAEQPDLSTAIEAATQQLENLLKLVPNTNSIKTGGESDEELECNFVSMMRQTPCSKAGKDWIIDSENVKNLMRKLKISLPDGRYVEVTHRGDVSLENGIKLRDVLYVPEFKQNLLSDCTNGELKGLGRVDNGLYHLKAHKSMTRTQHKEEHKMMSSHNVETKYQHSINIKSVNDSDMTSDIFDLIHMDIWGPYKVAYEGKYRYFLTLVDDKSRGIWVYLLGQKSEAFNTLKYFYESIKTQFCKRIKVIRSNNALEFDDYQCKNLFEENGILHQTSIVDRPQQNGVVERNHRHLLEMRRALRFHSGLTLEYWGDCVLTAAHLINRIPSSVNKNQTPYEVIYGKAAYYGELKVFGCLVMAYNPDRSKDKFQPRGVPRVFL